jgi:dolichol-phosphate mannosyltransferase
VIRDRVARVVVWLGNGLALAQIIVAIRVLFRFARTALAEPIRTIRIAQPPSLSIVVPVLNEVARLGPCLEGLARQGTDVSEILVIDGGSEDGTQELVEEASMADTRIRLLSADPVPPDWNGKAWGMETGWSASNPVNDWVLFMDADTRPSQWLAASLIVHAHEHSLSMLSVATRQRVDNIWLGLLHPAMLTTLLYRFGIPGQATHNPRSAQGNGQCMLVRRAALEALGGLPGIRASRCEDVTLARLLAASKRQVGFFESDGLVGVRMYEHWSDAWHGWSRSLPLRDHVTGWRFLVGLTEIMLAQALPLLLTARFPGGKNELLPRVNRLLILVRVGVLIGSRRAYERVPVTYWLSPLMDLPVAILLWRSAFQAEHRWRGRIMVRTSP